jgi:uncharacterized damage-inducible protein DinB
MNLLDRLLGHDSWTTRKLLLLCQRLTDEQLDREFDIAHRTVRATLEHIIGNVEAWSDLMAGRPIRVDKGRSVSELIDRFDRAANDLAEISKSVAKRDGWDESWTDPVESPPVARTFGGSIAHVITHSMHHRAQLLYMMRRLEVEGLPEGDVLSWEHEAGTA